MEQNNYNLKSKLEDAEIMLQSILTECDKRHKTCDMNCTQCNACNYGEFCQHDCEKCLEYIHFPDRVPQGAPKRKYDCPYMADVYTCKYTCKYTSEIIYAIRRDEELMTKEHLKVLSFGCGPCTDLFAIDYLKRKGEMLYKTIEYRGIDYSEDVWHHIHHDIKSFENDSCRINFYYADMCEIMHKGEQGVYLPNLIIFQYVFSDMQKHTGEIETKNFINKFSQYYNTKLQPNTCIILNDINLGNNYGGGREYFDLLFNKVKKTSTMTRGRFHNNNRTNTFPYGDNSDGEFPDNTILFEISNWKSYSPFDKCTSAQMLIKKGAGI